MTDTEKQKVFDLIKQAKEGKQYAFSQLYERFKTSIYNTIYFIVKNKDVTEDLLANTFAKAFCKIDSYVYNISFEMWLKTIAVNSSIDYIRHIKVEKYNIALDDSDNYIQLSDEHESTPEKELLCKELKALFDEVMEEIQPNYRDVLDLRINKNMSYAQISEALHMSENHVKSLLNRARKKLKTLLNQKD